MWGKFHAQQWLNRSTFSVEFNFEKDDQNQLQMKLTEYSSVPQSEYGILRVR